MPRAAESGAPSASVIGCLAFLLEKQYHGLPRTQDRHVPQGARQASITKSPGATLSTPAPTASTVPAAS